MKPLPHEPPQTFDEAVKLLVGLVDADDRKFILANEPIMVHQTAGQLLRNRWELWKPLTPLVLDFQKRFQLFGHSDDITGFLWHCVFQEIKGLPWLDGVEAIKYANHWRYHGINPVTGDQLKIKISG